MQERLINVHAYRSKVDTLMIGIYGTVLCSSSDKRPLFIQGPIKHQRLYNAIHFPLFDLHSLVRVHVSVACLPNGGDRVFLVEDEGGWTVE